MRRRDRNPAERLRAAVEALPRHTRQAMLCGIAANPIIVGAYVDRDSGGVCPMLAAHRNGGRTSLASFARAWDRYTRAKRPRLATRREVRTLRALLEMSLSPDGATDASSISAAAAQIRAERAAIAERVRANSGRDVAPAPEGDTIRIRRRRNPSEHHPSRELRDRVRWALMRPALRYEELRELLAAAKGQVERESPPLALDQDRSVAHLR